MSHTLLLADDSVTIQRVIELTFADEDIRVIAVGDGQQAIDRIKADPPDIVLADTGMPERDGYDVATFIKQDPGLAHIPVVLLTGAFEPVDEDRARKVGCDGVLVKPFEPQVVIDRVRDLLSSRSAAVPTTSGPATVGSPQDAEAEVPTRPAETDERPSHDPDETLELPSQLSAAESEPPSPAASEDDFNSLEGALSVLEGALDKLDLEGLDVPATDAPAADGSVAQDVSPSTADAAAAPEDWSLEEPVPAVQAPPSDDTPATPSTSDAAAAPEDRPIEEPVPAVQFPPPDDMPATAAADFASVPLAPDASASPPSASSGAVIEPVSLTEVQRPVETPAPLPEAEPVSPVAPAPLPEPVVASAPEPAPPSPPRSPEAGVSPVELVPASAPVGAPPSLADAFASLLAAERGGAERAQTVYPWPRPAASSGINEELIERVAERVITRLSGGVTSELVAQVVARVVEKLVREELERVKQT